MIYDVGQHRNSPNGERLKFKNTNKGDEKKISYMIITDSFVKPKRKVPYDSRTKVCD